MAASVWDVFREGSRFFTKKGDVYETLRGVAKRLDEEGLDYAVTGAMALAAHGYRRFTEDVDILLRPETLERFREELVGLGYLPAFSGARKSFRDTRTGVKIKVMTTGEFPADGKPKPVAFPDPVQARVDKDQLWVVELETLIELKLASGLSASHRLKDLADVQELILHLRLPLEFAKELDESVRSEYVRLWNAFQQAPDEQD